MTAEEADEFHTDGPAPKDELAELRAERDALAAALTDAAAFLIAGAHMEAAANKMPLEETPLWRAHERARAALPSPERPAPVGEGE